MSHSASLQTFLDARIASKAAPGLIAVAFDRSGVIASASAGVSNLDTNAPMKEDSVLWMASMSKSVSSVAALMLVEKHNFDIDSHDELAKIVPELANTPGNAVWTLFDGKDDEGNWKFRPASVGITLRHLLTHCAGFTYDFNSEEGKWTTDPEGGNLESVFTAKISALSIPRLFEAGTRYQYGINTDFVGLFITRLSGLTIRKYYQDMIFTPLGISHDLDIWRSPSMDERRVQMAFQVGPKAFIPLPTPFDTAQFENEPPAGMTPLTSGPLHGTVTAFATYSRGLLNELKIPGAAPLLSPEMWKLATVDQMVSMKIPVNKPFAESHNPHLVVEIDTWSKAADPKSESNPGWNLLQTVAVTEDSASGMKAGSFGWCGLANSFYFVDPVQGCGGIIASQFFPWGTPEMIQVKNDFETWVIEANKA